MKPQVNCSKFSFLFFVLSLCLNHQRRKQLRSSPQSASEIRQSRATSLSSSSLSSPSAFSADSTASAATNTVFFSRWTFEDEEQWETLLEVAVDACRRSGSDYVRVRAITSLNTTTKMQLFFFIKAFFCFFAFYIFFFVVKQITLSDLTRSFINEFISRIKVAS